MISRILGTTVCTAVLATCAGAQTIPLVEQIAGRLTANALKADVSFLASDALLGRANTSPEFQIAAEFIAAQFRRAGLEPLGDEGYFQTATFTAVTPSAEGVELTFESGSRTIVADQNGVGVANPAAFQLRNAPIMKLSAVDPAVLKSMAPKDLRGKAFVGEPSDPALHDISEKEPPPFVILLMDEPAPSDLGSRVRDTPASTSRRVPTLIVWDPVMRAALKAAKDGKVAVRIEAPTSAPVRLRNIAGVLRGSDPSLKNTFVLVTAHYDHLGGRASNEGDHIYNGANDDASGTASVIEIAAALASLPEKPKRSIVFMTFFGEEVGRLGSRYYSRHPLVPLAKTVAQVNLEHLGRTDGESVPRVGQAKVLGFDYSSATDVLRDAAEEVGVQLVNDKEHSATYYGVTDCRPLAEVGVPAVTLSIGMAPDYHLPSDEWQKQDYDNMAKLARAAALGVYRLAESSEAPQWNGQNPQTERYRRAREEAAGGSGVK